MVVIRPWYYYWCYFVLADSNLAWLSSKRLYEQLTETDADAPCNKQWTEVGDPYGRVRGRIKGI